MLVLVATRFVRDFIVSRRILSNKDKHKAPSSTLPYPLSLQDAGTQTFRHSCFPDPVVNNHQDKDALSLIRLSAFLNTEEIARITRVYSLRRNVIA